MQATIQLINQRLKNAPQEVLDHLLAYLDGITSENSNSIPQWQQDLVLDRKKIKEEEYLPLDDLDKEIKLQK
jgi:hypothetical protein